VTRSFGGNSASDQKLRVVRHLGGRRGREEGLVRDVIGTVREHLGRVIKLYVARRILVDRAERQAGLPLDRLDPRQRAGSPMNAGSKPLGALVRFDP
jgi:hypothetical protein